MERTPEGSFRQRAGHRAGTAQSRSESTAYPESDSFCSAIQERQFQKERQAQRPRTERAIEDDEFDQQERIRRSKQPWWERDDGENGPGARKPRPLSAGTGTGGGLTRGRFFGPGRDAVEQRKSPQKGGFFQYPPPPRSPDKGRRSAGAEMLQGAQEEVYEGRRKSLGMIRDHKMANKAGRAMNRMAGGGAQKTAQQMEEEERAMQEKRMREAQQQQQQQQRRRGGGGGAEEEMWHELGVEKKFGPGILRILKALAKEQQEGRDGGDGTLDQHEFRTVIRAGVESASPPADPIGPATLPDIVIKELFFRCACSMIIFLDFLWDFQRLFWHAKNLEGGHASSMNRCTLARTNGSTSRHLFRCRKSQRDTGLARIKGS